VSTGSQMHFLTPTYRPAGGVVKVFDYLVHALELGYEAHVHCPVTLSEDEALFSIPRFTSLRGDPRVTFHRGLNVGVWPRDWVLFSWPAHYEQIARGLDLDTPHERVIHLVQNTRHANPEFAEGYPIRLLARPMARIMVAHEVTEAVRPHLNRSSAATTIVEAHDWGFFQRVRRGGLPLRMNVGYTTWKSDLGVRVQRAAGSRFAFRSIRRTASWSEVRELLHWSDVFMCCPGPQEGFYLPGLEALAAGALVMTPDVGGNRAYCRFGENCLEVGFEDVGSYVAALSELQRSEPGRVQALRDRGYATLEGHRLARERAAFGQFLIELSARCARSRAGV
jgi:hypothetical protein